MFKKAKKHPKISDPEQLRTIYARLAESSLTLKLRLGAEVVRARVIDELDGTVFVGFRLEEVERFGIKVNNILSTVFYHEGKEYYAGMPVLGVGRYDSQEAMRLKIPETLSIRDDFGLTTLNVSPRLDVTFTNMFNTFCSGQMVNLGADGLDLLNKEGVPTKEMLAVDRVCDIAFNLDDHKFYCKGRVLYITNTGEELIGIQFEGLDNKDKDRIKQWIAQRTSEKLQRDKEWLQKHLAGVFRRGGKDEARKPRGPRLSDDFKTVLHPPGDAETVLVLCRDEALIARIAKVLKRKFGVLISKGRFKNVKLILDYYQPDLVLVNASLDTISGFDLVGTVKEHLPDAPAMVIMGEEESSACAKRANAVGAADYWAIEPFRPLSFFRQLEDALDMVRMAKEAREAQEARERAREEARKAEAAKAAETQQPDAAPEPTDPPTADLDIADFDPADLDI